MLRIAAHGAFVACLLAGAPAKAEGSAADRALAEVLFREARELMQAGKTAAACSKFHESYRLDKALGTLLNLAVCHEEAGQLASAWARYNEAVALARQKQDAARLDFAEKGSQRLEGRFATLRIVLVKDLSEVHGFRCTLDDRELGRASLDTPIPVDPGAHRVTVGAAGYETWVHSLNVSGDTSLVTLEVPALQLAKSEPRASASPQTETSPTDADPRETGSAQRAWALGVGAVGVVGLGVAVGFGVHALNEKNERDELCPGGSCESEAGIEAHRSADSAATAANVAAVAGGVLLAAGVVLYFTAPKETPRSRTSGLVLSWGRLSWLSTWD